MDFDTARYYESGQEQDTELLGTKEYALQNSMDLDSLMPALIFMPWGLFFNRLLTGEYPKHQLADDRYRSVISKCIRWNPEERFQTIEELEAALHDNISSDIGKPGFMLSSIHSNIPGFRTGKLWKIILAFFGYLSFLYCSMTSDFTNAKTGLPLTGLQLWHERFFVFLMLLSLIFYNFNYKNIRTRSFLGHSLPLYFELFYSV